MFILEWLYTHHKGNLAYYDRLTQVYNRNWWELKAKKSLRGKDIYITLIDMDDLKTVNDSLGHLEGDNHIISLVSHLKTVLPQATICRLGGDEFILISKDNPTEILQTSLTQYNFSYGVTHKYIHTELTEALRCSDDSMYQMKRQRKSSST